ncbi:MAG: hypothetical protein H6666_12735 [Ardenticatenaceae bacterium]|nr:hypothetical protein [Anaerolineales bacterium]MCB8918775.1 hypothetical protein [Ardenticatenaceae bacterium]
MPRPDDNIQDVLDHLAPLTPDAAEAPRPAGQMLAQIKRQIAMPPAASQPAFAWRIRQMFKRSYAMAAVLAILVLVVALAFPPVRAAASDFLGLFRVQKFAAISVSPQQMATLERIANEGLYPGEFQLLTDPGEPQTVSSLGQAEELYGRAVRTSDALGKPVNIGLTAGGQGQLVVNLEGARAIMAAAELDPMLLPDSLDGAVIAATIYPAVAQEWADGTVLVQTESPLVNYPDDVNPAVLGEALLQFLGMTPGEARRLASNIDWTNTLLLPVPTDVASFSELQIDGVSALGLSNLRGQGGAIMWEKNGTVYLLSSSDKSLAELRDIAKTLR